MSLSKDDKGTKTTSYIKKQFSIKIKNFQLIYFNFVGRFFCFFCIKFIKTAKSNL